MENQASPIPSWDAPDAPDADEHFVQGLDDIDNETKEAQEKERYRQDTKHRDYLVRWVVYTNSAWLIAILVIVIAHGAANEDGTDLFQLSDTVMVTLLATTTANVLGLALIVLRGLFSDSNGNH